MSSIEDICLLISSEMLFNNGISGLHLEAGKYSSKCFALRHKNGGCHSKSHRENEQSQLERCY